MIWYGQYNAILGLALLGSVGLSFMVGTWEIFLAVFLLVILVRIGATFINMLFKAFAGFPLIYDTKIMMVEARNKREAREA